MRFSAKPYSSRSTPNKSPGIEPLHLRRLVEAIARKHKRAFADFYECTHLRVYATARSVLSSRQDAEEIVSDVFMYVWDHAHLYDLKRGEVTVWLGVIARNRSIDRLRQRRYDLPFDAQYHQPAVFAPELKSPECLVANWQEGRILHRQVCELPPLRQQLLVLSFFHELSHKSIADLLKLPRGTVKSHIRRALMALRPALSLWRTGYEAEFEAH